MVSIIQVNFCILFHYETFYISKKITGRKFDKYGNLRQWWTNQTIETFEKNTDCFVKQYDNYTIRNINENVSVIK